MLRPDGVWPQTRAFLVHRPRLVRVAFATAVLTGAAGAEDGDGRYRLSPTPEGFLKLDSRSGAVSACKRGPDGYHSAGLCRTSKGPSRLSSIGSPRRMPLCGTSGPQSVRRGPRDPV